MEGWSSDASSQFCTSNKPNDESQFPDFPVWDFDELHAEESFAWHSQWSGDGGFTNTDPETEQNQLNRVETSESSLQTKPESSKRRGAKLSPAQRRENKRQSDIRYRQRRKVTAEALDAENKMLKEANKDLKEKNKFLSSEIRNRQRLQVIADAENKMLKEENERLIASVGILRAQIAYVIDMKHQSVSVQDHHGIQRGAAGKLSINELQHPQEMVSKNTIATSDYVIGNQKDSQTVTCCNDDPPITELLMKIDADDESKVNLSDFTGLDGERRVVGKYSYPLSLLPVVKGIIDVYGDIFSTTKMNQSAAETIYIMFFASIKEMSDRQLDQVTEDRILKWRDAFKDALRINSKMDFAMKHLKKIACSYIGLMERQKLEKLAKRISDLEADLTAGKEEHARICEQSKVYMDAADVFNGMSVSSGMF